ncbi:MAG: dTDP-glucose 4,6-dehydratase [Actinomycetes bacterium]
MKYVVTGGCGFIGSNYVRGLLSDRWGSNVEQLTVIDSLTYAGNLANLDPAKSDPRLTFVREDIVNQKEITQILEGHDIVVHFAAESHVDRSISGSAEFIRTNVLGTHSMLQASLNANIKQFLHVSTDEVYGSISEGSWDEQEPLLPNSPYAASKASSDLIARSFFVTHGLDVRITRCSNNFGIYQYPEKVIPLFITNLMEGKKVPLYGDGLNVRDWLHVDDHCRGIQLVIDKGRAGQIYNIGGGTELSNIDLTMMIIDAMGATTTSIEPVEDRKAHDRRYSVDITKIHNELGYAPQCTLHDTLSDIVNWYKSNEQWWKPLKSQ